MMRHSLIPNPPPSFAEWECGKLGRGLGMKLDNEHYTKLHTMCDSDFNLRSKRIFFFDTCYLCVVTAFVTDC